MTNAQSTLAQLITSTPRFSFNRWSVGVTTIALILSLPVLVVFGSVFAPAGEVWQHLADTVLADYVLNSLILAGGVGVGALAIGTGAAWLVAYYDFPLRRTIEWMLLLPLAIPAYIIAYTYTGVLSFEGPLQSWLRETFHWQYGDYWFPEIRSLGGAIVMLSLVLFPYVYMLTRAAFLEQSATALEVARTLGTGPWRRFFRVALPLARPAIVAGASFAIMEALADYGTVKYFGVSTFTTGIFRTWFGLGNPTAAAQLAAMLTGLVFTLLVLEHYTRRHLRYGQRTQRNVTAHREQLSGVKAAVATALGLFPIVVGFLLPAGQLGIWAWDTAADTVDARFLSLLGNSLWLAASAALVTVSVSLLLAYGRRLHPNNITNVALRVGSLGYAVPGTVIAVGVMMILTFVDRQTKAAGESIFGISFELFLAGSIVAVMFAYAVRFMAVSLNSVEAGLTRIRPSIEDAARSLGLSPRSVLARVHVPMLRRTLLTAMLLVFVDVLKELPATLILRPFNFNTLAIRAFELASDERLADSSTAALAIVLAGLGPVILLSRAIGHSGTER